MAPPTTGPDAIELTDPFDPLKDLTIEVTDKLHTVRQYTFFGVDWFGFQLDSPPGFKDLTSASNPDPPARKVRVIDDLLSTDYVEVSRPTSPSSGQYRVDYHNVLPEGKTELTNQRTTGLIQFNSSAVGRVYRVSYWFTGLGVLTSTLAGILANQTIPGDLDIAGLLTVGSFSRAPLVQVFTSNGIFAEPAGIIQYKITVTGAGAGGGRSFAGGGGGGGGGKCIKWITSGLGGPVTVTVGGGGAGDSGAGAGAGGASSFGAFCSSTGGAAPVDGLGAPGGVGSDGDVNDSLGDGSSAFDEGGKGGGPGGRGGLSVVAGGDAPGFGGGGGGGSPGGGADGGSGKGGIVTVEY